VTLAGTLAAASLLESVTVAPPAGAGAVSETVPVAGWPPWTRLGLTPRLDSETVLIALSLEIEAEIHTGQAGRIWSWQRVGGETGWQDTLQIFDRNHGCYAQPSRREEAPRRVGEHR